MESITIKQLESKLMEELTKESFISNYVYGTLEYAEDKESYEFELQDDIMNYIIDNYEDLLKRYIITNYLKDELKKCINNDKIEELFTDLDIKNYICELENDLIDLRAEFTGQITDQLENKEHTVYERGSIYFNKYNMPVTVNSEYCIIKKNEE